MNHIFNCNAPNLKAVDGACPCPLCSGRPMRYWFFFPVYALLQKLLQLRTSQKNPFLTLLTKRKKIWVYRRINNEYGYKDWRPNTSDWTVERLEEDFKCSKSKKAGSVSCLSIMTSFWCVLCYFSAFCFMCGNSLGDAWLDYRSWENLPVCTVSSVSLTHPWLWYQGGVRACFRMQFFCLRCAQLCLAFGNTVI